MKTIEEIRESGRILNCKDLHIGNMCSLSGYVMIPPKNTRYSIMITDHDGLGHVSISHSNKLPTWDDMCYVKSICFNDEEMAIQYHPKKSEYVNFQENTLHIWDANVVLNINHNARLMLLHNYDMLISDISSCIKKLNTNMFCKCGENHKKVTNELAELYVLLDVYFNNENNKDIALSLVEELNNKKFCGYCNKEILKSHGYINIEGVFYHQGCNGG